jgi:AcrR family transcriptional regulator
MPKRKPNANSSPASPLQSADKHPYHHGDLRSALIAAALTLIELHGVKGFTLKDAARIAGVSIAAPYRHFADKDELLSTIQIEGFTRFNVALQAANDQASTPQAKIIELGVAYVQFALQHPAHFRVMFNLESKPGGSPHAARTADSSPDGFSLLVQAVAELYPSASQQEIYDHVLEKWSLVHGFALLQLDGSILATVGNLDPEAQLRRTLALSLPAHSNASADADRPSTGMLNQ